MKLCDLIAAVSAAGEQASEAARREYAENVEALHAVVATKLPGSPPLSTVVPLDTLNPKRLRLRTRVTLTEQDGAIDAEFTAPTKHWWNRTPRNVSTLEIEWDRQDAPEGVCRIRDTQNLALDDSLKKLRATEGKTHG